MILPKKIKVRGGALGEMAQAINDLIDYAQSLRPADSIHMTTEHTRAGVIRKPKAIAQTEQVEQQEPQAPRWL